MTTSRLASRSVSGRRLLVAAASVVLALAAGSLPAVAAGAPRASSSGFTVDQARLLDTRTGPFAGPVSGFVQVHVGSDVPAGATVELTVTTTQSAGTGYVTAYPDGAQAPATSNVNFTQGVTYSSAVDILVPANGKIDLTVSGAPTQLVVDQQGFFAATALTGVEPQRIADSRSGLGFAATGPQSGTVTLPIPASAAPAGSGVLALNVTVTGAGGPGNVVAYSGGAVPASSSVNYAEGTTASNLVYVTPTSGTVSFTVRGAPVNIVVDLFGYAPQGSTFTAATPARIADSRAANGLPPGPLTGAQTVTLTAAQVPPGTSAVALNLTATGATGVGYVVAYPGGSSRPATSELQFTQGLTTAQTVVVPVGASNQVSLYVGGTGPTQLVVDYEGAVGGS